MNAFRPSQNPDSQYGYGTGFDVVGAAPNPDSQYGYGTGYDLVGAQASKMWMSPYGQIYGNVAGDPRTGVMLHYPSPQTSGLDDVKNWLNNKSLGDVENKYWLAGGIVLAGTGLWYGYKKRWFK